jgi:DNA-directed RNA polymerase specialized sigma24 family protein
MTDGRVHQPFPPTQWTMVRRAGLADDQAREVLDVLLQKYLLALRTHLVIGRRISEDVADDLLQSFVTNKILERSIVSLADPARGRFRTFLLTALDRYVANQVRDQGRAKRSPTCRALAPLEIGFEPACRESSAAAAFDIAWARQVIAAALKRMEDECRTDRPTLWMLFQHRVVAPAFEGVEAMDYEQMIQHFGFATPTQAANALVTAKRMFIRNLRAVVAEYADDDQDVDEEIRQLQAILSGTSAGSGRS